MSPFQTMLYLAAAEQQQHQQQQPASAAPASSLSNHRPAPLKQHALLDPLAIAEVALEGCCDHGCLRTMSLANIEAARSEYAALGAENDRSVWALSRAAVFADRAQRRAADSKSELHSLRGVYCVGELSVCERAFLRCYGLSRGKWERCLHLQRQGAVKPPLHGNTGGREAPLQEAVAGWIAEYERSACDRISDTVSLLPSGTDYKELYELYANEAAAMGQSVASHSTFMAVLRGGEFARLKVVPADSFAHCRTCEILREAGLAAHLPSAVERVRADWALHQRKHRAAREHLHSLKALASSPSSDTMLLYVDVSSGFRLPTYQRTPSVRAPFRLCCALLAMRLNRARVCVLAGPAPSSLAGRLVRRLP